MTSEEEIARLLPLARKHAVPVTFRAAGTSLSGQALTDSVLLKISHTGRAFRNYTVHGDGSSITVQPGLIGGEVGGRGGASSTVAVGWRAASFSRAAPVCSLAPLLSCRCRPPARPPASVPHRR